MVETRTQELVEHSEGVLDLGDIERLHDMRVATRRLRAALEVFQPCFPKKRYKAAHREVKALADALGERRDRDVTLEELDRFAAGLGAADRPGVRSLAAAVRDEQAEANLRLAPSVTAERVAALAERLALAGGGGAGAGRTGAGGSAGGAARVRTPARAAPRRRRPSCRRHRRRANGGEPR